MTNFNLKACFFAVAVCSSAGAASAQQLQEISIGVASLSLGSASGRIADDLGLFEKHGLKATLPVMDRGNAAITALVSGSLKFVVSGVGDLITAKARGLNVVVIANTFGGFGGYLILSKSAVEKSGISPNAPVRERFKALDGLTIGSASPTSTLTVLPKISTEAVGAKINFTYMNQPATLAALSSGVIQGAGLAAPYSIRAIAQGGVLWINGPKGEFSSENALGIGGALATTREYAEANPELIKKIRAVFEDLGKAVDERPADVKKAIAKMYPEIDTQSVDLLFDMEAPLWKTKPITPSAMARDIGLMKLFGVNAPGLESLDPASLLLK